MPVWRVGIREARINFNRLMKEVQEGREIILTDRGKPVAKLLAIDPNELTIPDRLAKLERNGWVDSASDNVKLPPPLPVGKGLAQKYLDEDRGQ